jgi:hypothetical protein
MRANILRELCSYFCEQLSGTDEEIRSLVTKVSGCLWATGASEQDINQILPLIIKSADNGGRRAVSGLIKGWSNAIRSLLALNHFNSHHVGYCKRARNCRFALRKLGATSDEINKIVDLYDDICGIPPILLLKPYWKVLLRSPSIDVSQAVAPLSNLSRCCPLADRDKCTESEKAFFETTGKLPLFSFDLTHVGFEYGSLCRKTGGSSHIQINSHASYDYSREDGGKWAEFRDHVVYKYLYLTIGDLIPTKPNSDLFDILGNLVLYKDDWHPGVPITDVMYPELKSEDSQLDRRLGLFSLDWAIRDLDFNFPGCIISDAPFLTFGPFSPTLRFDGKLPSRVSTLAEEGFKARVITIVKLSASIIQGVARYFLDPPMRTDTQVKIGLLSKVKLYDFLVHCSGNDRRGVDNYQRPSVFPNSALSADLTTATDTPYRLGPLSMLRGFVKAVSNEKLIKFLNFAIDVGCSPRGFDSRFLPLLFVHRCGIMMGEGLSGTYLNTMSGIVRAIIEDFMLYFDFYQGTTVEDAELFIVQHLDMIEDYLNNVNIDSFGVNSTQSGDDLILLNGHDPSDARRFLILLYTILGERPSESTFYSSEFYATFTEEMAIKHTGTLGWVFIDCIKPRLYTHTSIDGVDPILSHIRQITGSLRYVKNEDYILRVCDVVDTIISSNHHISDRVKKYKLVLPFPPEFGGLDHPIQLIDGLEIDIPLEDRAMIRKLLTCNLEELWEIKYSWISEDLDNDDAQEIRDILRRVFSVFSSLEQGTLGDDNTIIDFTRYSEDILVNRDMYPSYNTYKQELIAVKSDLGLATLDEIAQSVANGLRMEFQLENSDSSPLNPLIKLRNRREFLMSKTAGLDGDGHSFVWSDLKSLRWRLQSSFQGSVVIRDSFLDLLDLHDLPSFSVPSPTFVE